MTPCLAWFAVGTAFLLVANVYSTQYINPILARQFADPCILAATDGNYYVYATTSSGNHFQVASSKNAVDFEYQGDAMPVLPTWATGSNDNWAPHVIQYSSDEYYMYFVAQSNQLNGTRCIGVAKSNNPLGPFQDASINNKPLICDAVSLGMTCDVIDPMVLYLPNINTTYLYYGSGAELKVQQLNNDHVSLNIDFNAEIVLNKNTSLDYQNLIEASWVHYKNGYYYYYFSGDDSKSHYAVMIARSNVGPLGPYEKKSDYYKENNYDIDVVLHLNEYFNVTGHLSILTDKNGDDWMYYHGVKIGEEDKGRMLLMDRIYYDEQDWPFVNNTSPSYSNQTGPIV